MMKLFERHEQAQEVFYSKDQAEEFASDKENAEIIFRPGFPIMIDNEPVYLSKDDMPAWVVWYDA